MKLCQTGCISFTWVTNIALGKTKRIPLISAADAFLLTCWPVLPVHTSLNLSRKSLRNLFLFFIGFFLSLFLSLRVTLDERLDLCDVRRCCLRSPGKSSLFCFLLELCFAECLALVLSLDKVADLRVARPCCPQRADCFLENPSYGNYK